MTEFGAVVFQNRFSTKSSEKNKNKLHLSILHNARMPLRGVCILYANLRIETEHYEKMNVYVLQWHRIEIKKRTTTTKKCDGYEMIHVWLKIPFNAFSLIAFFFSVFFLFFTFRFFSLIFWRPELKIREWRKKSDANRLK